ncbi:MAG: hypothetical protein H0U77_03315 [Nocardioidaceae bacterium]|nr:hypothetical protein [Nocardioidaceae bacterium]
MIIARPLSRIPISMLLMMTSITAHAATTVSNCAAGDSPAGFNVGTVCNNFCTFGANELSCDVTAVCGAGADAVAVGIYDTAANNDYTAWVDCGAVNFCCATDEDVGAVNEINIVSLKGSSSDDNLSFDYPAKPATLSPTAPHDLLAKMFGGDEDCAHLGTIGDTMFGSSYPNGDYGEILDGEAGCDTISGNEGNDKIFGGDHDDVCNGNDGADRIDGGAGADDMIGETGTDTLCDTNCSLAGGTDFMDGGDQNDRLWYAATCGVTPLAAASTAGIGSGDECGDAVAFGPLPWLQCETNLTGGPLTCP